MSLGDILINGVYNAMKDLLDCTSGTRQLRENLTKCVSWFLELVFAKCQMSPVCVLGQAKFWSWLYGITFLALDIRRILVPKSITVFYVLATLVF